MDNLELKIAAKVDFTEARRDLASFADEAARGVKFTPRAGAVNGSSPSRDGLDRLDELAGDSYLNRAQMRYASSLERLAVATERQAAAMESGGLSGGGGRGGRGGRGIAAPSPTGGNPIDSVDWGKVPFSEGEGAAGGNAGGGALQWWRRAVGPVGRRYGSQAALFWALSSLSSHNSASAAADISASGADNALERNEGLSRQLHANSFAPRQFVVGLTDPENSTAAIDERIHQSSRIYQRNRFVFGSGLDRMVSQVARNGYESGGEIGEQRARIAGQGVATRSDLQQQINEMQAQQPAWASIKDPMDALEYAARAGKISELQKKKRESATQDDFEINKIDTQRGITAAGIAAQSSAAREITQGLDTRTRNRDDLIEQQKIARLQMGAQDKGQLPALDKAHREQLDAYDFQANREAGWSNALNRSQANASRLRGANENFLGDLESMSGRNKDELDRTRAEDPSRVAAVQERQQADRGAYVNQTFRSWGLQSRGDFGQAAATNRLLQRDPLGAQLMANENARGLALDSMSTVERMARGPAVSARYDAQGALIKQQYQDARSLDLIGLRGGVESSSLRAAGKDFSASAVDIGASAMQRATAYSQRGLQEERSLTLGTGINDLRGLQRRLKFGGSAEEIDAGGGRASGGTSETVDGQEDVVAALGIVADKIDQLQEALVGNGDD